MKRFAFLLVCLLFSTTLIGMTRAQGEEENKGTDTADNANQDKNKTGEAVNENNETANGNNEEPNKTDDEANKNPTKGEGDDENVTNAPETDDTVTEAATVPAVTEGKKDDAEATTKGSAGSVLPNLLVVVATAVAGYNFAS